MNDGTHNILNCCRVKRLSRTGMAFALFWANMNYLARSFGYYFLCTLLLAGGCAVEQSSLIGKTGSIGSTQELILCHSDRQGCSFESSDNCPLTLPAEMDSCIEDDGLNSCFYCPGGEVPTSGQGLRASFCLDDEWSYGEVSCE
jgi:hypothetical protein